MYRGIKLCLDFENGAAVPDGKLDTWWASVVSGNGTIYRIGNGSMLIRAMLGHLEGDLAVTVVRQDGQESTLNDLGLPTPSNFLYRTNEQILDLAFRLARARADINLGG